MIETPRPGLRSCLGHRAAFAAEAAWCDLALCACTGATRIALGARAGRPRASPWTVQSPPVQKTHRRWPLHKASHRFPRFSVRTRTCAMPGARYSSLLGHLTAPGPVIRAGGVSGEHHPVERCPAKHFFSGPVLGSVFGVLARTPKITDFRARTVPRKAPFFRACAW